MLCGSCVVYGVVMKPIPCRRCMIKKTVKGICHVCLRELVGEELALEPEEPTIERLVEIVENMVRCREITNGL